MPVIDFDQQERLNREHLADPRVGDYWNEMFVPVCVVLGRDGNDVIVCKKIVSTDHDHWTWDLRYVERMTLAAFAGWLSYGSESMKHKTWAWVVPKAHVWARREALATVLGSDGGLHA